jgi:site-specific DNA-cytosine methylase
VDTCPDEYTSLSLCSGYGGIELGLREVVRTRTLCYVEIGVEVCEILVNLMEQKLIDEAPIWSDLATFPDDLFCDRVDIVMGGFPCQPFSNAGLQKGAFDPRNLWPSVSRVIRGVRPSVVFLENVPGILPYYFSTIRPELREMGYVVTEGLFSAGVDGGAPQRRQRIFILAYSEGTRLQRRGIPRLLADYIDELADTAGAELPRWLSGEEGGQGIPLSEPAPQGRGLADAGQQYQQLQRRGIRPESEREGSELALPDSSEAGRQIRHDSPVWPSEGQTSEPRPGQRGRELAELPLFPPGPNDSRGWEWSLSQWPQLSPTYCKEGHDVQADLSAAPRGVRRVVDGSVSGVDKRLRATGNGVVPIVAALAFHTLGRGRIL